MSEHSEGLTTASCTIDMRFDPEDREESLRLLVALSEQTRARRSCRSCHVAVNAAEPASVHYREEWDSEVAFHQHVQSETFRRLLFVLDLCVEEPRVLVEVLSWHRGVSRLRTLRASEAVRAG
jgi:quinol monooxygenase YgiN